MKLEHSFDVEAPLERVWARLIDIEQVAPCLPGAEITESSEDRRLRRQLHGQARPDDGRVRRRSCS